MLYRAVFTTLLVLSLFSCRENGDNFVVSVSVPIDALENGDIIMRRCDGVVARFSASVSQHDGRYSHCGVVIRREDSIFVSHSDFDAMQTILEPMDYYLAEASAWGIYRLKAAREQCDRLAATALYYVGRHTPFDLAYDALDTTKLYCTQMVAMSVNQALDSMVIIPATSFGGKLLFANDDIFLNNCLFLVAESKN